MKIAIYPGTFDPFTNGHMDIVKRAVKLFDKVIVTIARNPGKNPMFSEQERLSLVKAALKGNKRVDVELFDGLLVEYAKKKKATAIVRGLRAISDFEYELQMALMNRKLNDKFETVFMMPNAKYTYLDSSIVREIARLGGDVSDFVPPVVQKALAAKIKDLM